MKKILTVLVVLLLMVGCAKKDDYAMGSYKDRVYTNKEFGLDFEIAEGYSFLTADELKLVNDANHEASKNPEQAKYFNKVMEVTNTDKVSMIMYVDATPEIYKNSDAEANSYLDFLTEQRVAYKLEKEDMSINGLEYKVLKLEFDFDQRQYSLYTVSEDKLINIQITYPAGHEASAQELLKMIDIDG